MNRLITSVLALAMTACAAQPLTEKKVVDTITIQEEPRLGTDGFMIRQGTTCTILLKKYPICLLHELKHCFEGSWHSEPNGDWCKE